MRNPGDNTKRGQRKVAVSPKHINLFKQSLPSCITFNLTFLDLTLLTSSSFLTISSNHHLLYPHCLSFVFLAIILVTNLFQCHLHYDYFLYILASTSMTNHHGQRGQTAKGHGPPKLCGKPRGRADIFGNT
jgi:hypothetical protein